MESRYSKTSKSKSRITRRKKPNKLERTSSAQKFHVESLKLSKIPLFSTQQFTSLKSLTRRRGTTSSTPFFIQEEVESDEEEDEKLISKKEEIEMKKEFDAVSLEIQKRLVEEEEMEPSTASSVAEMLKKDFQKRCFTMSMKFFQKKFAQKNQHFKTLEIESSNSKDDTSNEDISNIIKKVDLTPEEMEEDLIINGEKFISQIEELNYESLFSSMELRNIKRVKNRMYIEFPKKMFNRTIVKGNKYKEDVVLMVEKFLRDNLTLPNKVAKITSLEIIYDENINKIVRKKERDLFRSMGVRGNVTIRNELEKLCVNVVPKEKRVLRLFSYSKRIKSEESRFGTGFHFFTKLSEKKDFEVMICDVVLGVVGPVTKVQFSIRERSKLKEKYDTLISCVKMKFPTNKVCKRKRDFRRITKCLKKKYFPLIQKEKKENDVFIVQRKSQILPLFRISFSIMDGDNSNTLVRNEKDFLRVNSLNNITNIRVLGGCIFASVNLCNEVVKGVNEKEKVEFFIKDTIVIENTQVENIRIKGIGCFECKDSSKTAKIILKGTKAVLKDCYVEGVEIEICENNSIAYISNCVISKKTRIIVQGSSILNVDHAKFFGKDSFILVKENSEVQIHTSTINSKRPLSIHDEGRVTLINNKFIESGISVQCFDRSSLLAKVNDFIRCTNVVDANKDCSITFQDCNFINTMGNGICMKDFSKGTFSKCIFVSEKKGNEIFLFKNKAETELVKCKFSNVGTVRISNPKFKFTSNTLTNVENIVISGRSFAKIHNNTIENSHFEISNFSECELNSNKFIETKVDSIDNASPKIFKNEFTKESTLSINNRSTPNVYENSFTFAKIGVSIYVEKTKSSILLRKNHFKSCKTGVNTAVRKTSIIVDGELCCNKDEEFFVRVVENQFVHNDICCNFENESEIELTGNVLNQACVGVSCFSCVLKSVNNQFIRLKNAYVCSDKSKVNMEHNFFQNIERGIIINNCETTISNCKFENFEEFVFKINSFDKSLTLIKNNELKKFKKRGIIVHSSSYVRIIENTFAPHNCDVVCIENNYRCKVNIVNNTFTMLSKKSNSIAILCKKDSKISIKQNKIEGSEFGVFVKGKSSGRMEENIIRNCRNGIYLNGDCVFFVISMENKISNCDVGILMEQHYNKLIVIEKRNIITNCIIGTSLSNCKCVITGNVYKRNEKAISSTNESSPNISENEFVENDISIFISDSNISSIMENTFKSKSITSEKKSKKYIIMVRKKSSPLIVSNEFIGSNVIHVGDCACPKINKNNFKNVEGNCIYVDGKASPSIRDNTFCDVYSAIVLTTNSLSSIQVCKNIFNAFKFAVKIGGHSIVHVEKNSFTKSTIRSSNNVDEDVLEKSVCVLSRNNAVGSIENNSFADVEIGVLCKDDARFLMKRNVFTKVNGKCVIFSTNNLNEISFSDNQLIESNVGLEVLRHSSPIIEDNKFIKIHSLCILVTANSKPKIEKNEFLQVQNGIELLEESETIVNSNHFKAKEVAILATGESKGTISSNTFNGGSKNIQMSGNSRMELSKNNFLGSSYAGIFAEKKSTPIILESFFGVKNEKFGIYASNDSYVEINSGEVKAKECGIFMDNQSRAMIREVSVVESQIGIFLSEKAKSKIFKCMMMKNHIGMKISSPFSNEINESFIQNNKDVGLLITEQANPKIVKNFIQHNREGLKIEDMGKGEYLSNDITKNKRNLNFFRTSRPILLSNRTSLIPCLENRFLIIFMLMFTSILKWTVLFIHVALLIIIFFFFDMIYVEYHCLIPISCSIVVIFALNILTLVGQIKSLNHSNISFKLNVTLILIEMFYIFVMYSLASCMGVMMFMFYESSWVKYTLYCIPGSFILLWIISFALYLLYRFDFNVYLV